MELNYKCNTKFIEDDRCGNRNNSSLLMLKRQFLKWIETEVL